MVDNLIVFEMVIDCLQGYDFQWVDCFLVIVGIVVSIVYVICWGGEEFVGLFLEFECVIDWELE